MAEPLRRTLSKLRGRRSQRGAAGGGHRHGGTCAPQGKREAGEGGGGAGLPQPLRAARWGYCPQHGELPRPQSCLIGTAPCRLR